MAAGVEAEAVAEAEEKFPADFAKRWFGYKSLMWLGNVEFRVFGGFSFNSPSAGTL